MVRTRASSSKAVTRSTESQGTSTPSASGDVSTIELSTVRVTRSRSRPNKVFKSGLFIAGSSSHTSDSEYSTPATSSVPTPAPERAKGVTTIEVQISQSRSLSARRASLPLRKSVALAKRKRQASLSDDDDDSENIPMSTAARSRNLGSKSKATKRMREDSDSSDEDEDVRRMAATLRSSRWARKSNPAKRTQPNSDSDDDYDAEVAERPPSILRSSKRVSRSTSNKPQLDDSGDPKSDAMDLDLGDITDSGASSADFMNVSEAAESDDSSPSYEERNGESSPESSSDSDSDSEEAPPSHGDDQACLGEYDVVIGNSSRERRDHARITKHHPEFLEMWRQLRDTPDVEAGKIEQPKDINRILKPFQLEGVAWMIAKERTQWKGGLLGDEMGLGKTIQAVSLIMSDFPAKAPSLVLVPPVALMQWQNEINSYTNNKLRVFVFHGQNRETKKMKASDLKKYNVVLMTYNSLESMYRKQVNGHKKKDVIIKVDSMMHKLKWHRIILDEAHCIKSRTTMTARACFALNGTYRWCLTGTPLQNRIGEFFSLVRFLRIQPFASYMCKECPCESLEWNMDDKSYCKDCNHAQSQHLAIFNQQLLNPIQNYGRSGIGAMAFARLRLLTRKVMLRRQKKDHMDSMELPMKVIRANRQFFGEEEDDFAKHVMTGVTRQFDTYVDQHVVANNYVNIFGLIMQMRQVANHPDLITKKSAEGAHNVLVCCVCDEPAEQPIRSKCNHSFCRVCAVNYIQQATSEDPDCPVCHIPLSIDLEQPDIEQDELLVKKSSIINRINMEKWTSSTKIELLVHELHKLRSDRACHKSIVFSQFTTMLQLIEWRLRRAGITTVMLDGSMSPSQRQASIDHFMNNSNVECFLVSLKAGGVALNLTEASQVFIVDPWWNPAAEWQSADRCHRIGQTRPCHITRLVIEDSVESRMVALQEKKSRMINSTINNDKGAIDGLTEQDLQFLFRGS